MMQKHKCWDNLQNSFSMTQVKQWEAHIQLYKQGQQLKCVRNYFKQSHHSPVKLIMVKFLDMSWGTSITIKNRLQFDNLRRYICNPKNPHTIHLITYWFSSLDSRIKLHGTIDRGCFCGRDISSSFCNTVCSIRVNHV